MDTYAPIIGMGMITIGLIMLIISIGLLIYGIWLRHRPETPPNPNPTPIDPANPPRINNPADNAPGKALLKTLFISVLLLAIAGGFSVLTWLSSTAEYQQTPAQETLIAVADWMIKGSAGAIAGIVIWTGLMWIKPKTP